MDSSSAEGLPRGERRREGEDGEDTTAEGRFMLLRFGSAAAAGVPFDASVDSSIAWLTVI
jgi:hypothetical protein